MKNLPRTHIEFCNMLHSCIDLADYEKGQSLKNIIESEKGKPLSITVVEDWLRGLPSACTIPFYDCEIKAILISCGNEHWSVDQYWEFAASRVLEFAMNPKAYQ